MAGRLVGRGFQLPPASASYRKPGKNLLSDSRDSVRPGLEQKRAGALADLAAPCEGRQADGSFLLDWKKLRMKF
jgi:hypothetical protein